MVDLKLGRVYQSPILDVCSGNRGDRDIVIEGNEALEGGSGPRNVIFRSLPLIRARSLRYQCIIDLGTGPVNLLSDQGIPIHRFDKSSNKEHEVNETSVDKH